MNLRLFAILPFLLPAAALAQPAPQQQSPAEQALAQRLTAEINNNLTCSANVITLQEQIKKLTAELAAKKPADEKHPAPKKKP